MIKILFILFFLSVGFSKDFTEYILESHPNGNPKEIEYYQKNDGDLILLRLVRLGSDGQIELEGNYQDRNRHGRWVWYYRDGPLKKKGSFDVGECSGDWNFYNSSGKKIRTKHCNELSNADLNIIYIKDLNHEEQNKESQEVEFVAFDRAPKPIIPISPAYPDIARSMGLEGKVFIKFFVDRNGDVHPDKVTIIKGIVGLNEAAIEAVKKSKWSPAMQRELKVGVYMTVPVNFKLRK